MQPKLSCKPCQIVDEVSGFYDPNLLCRVMRSMHQQGQQGHPLKVHFIGIGGIGMSSLAHLCLHAGWQVQGSNAGSSEITQKLTAAGAQVFYQHHHGRLGAEVALVVVSSAINTDNPEWLDARAAGIPVVHRSDFLRQWVSAYQTMAVTGTHGKTTTTALLGHVLTSAGLDPLVITGGIMQDHGSTVCQGQGPYAVVEADESDRSHLNFHNIYAGIITNIEPDHMQTYDGDPEVLLQAFDAFAHLCQRCVMLCGQDPGVQALLARYPQSLGYNQDIVDQEGQGVLHTSASSKPNLAMYSKSLGGVEQESLAYDQEASILPLDSQRAVVSWSYGGFNPGFASAQPFVEAPDQVVPEHVRQASSFMPMSCESICADRQADVYGVADSQDGVWDQVAGSMPDTWVLYGLDTRFPVHATRVRATTRGMQFDVTTPWGCMADVTLALWGEHNVLNALAVWGLSVHLGISPEKIAHAMATFAGVQRRMTGRGTCGGVPVIDDYAHHPTEISAVLRALTLQGFKKILVVCQPHRYSRLHDTMDLFVTCFDGAYKVFILPVYSAGEAPIAGVCSDVLVQRMHASGRRYGMAVAEWPLSRHAIISSVTDDEVDCIVCVGAGSITDMAGALGQTDQVVSMRTDSVA